MPCFYISGIFAPPLVGDAPEENSISNFIEAEIFLLRWCHIIGPIELSSAPALGEGPLSPLSSALPTSSHASGSADDIKTDMIAWPPKLRAESGTSISYACSGSGSSYPEDELFAREEIERSVTGEEIIRIEDLSFLRTAVATSLRSL